VDHSYIAISSFICTRINVYMYVWIYVSSFIWLRINVPCVYKTYLEEEWVDPFFLV
jgi:hypothetical protein